MAKVVITFDTVDKTANATIDGTEVPNFSSVNVYGGYKNKYGLELTSGVEDEDNDMRQWTRVCASEQSGDKLVDKKDEAEAELDEAIKKEVYNFFLMDD